MVGGLTAADYLAREDLDMHQDNCNNEQNEVSSGPKLQLQKKILFFMKTLVF